MVNMVRGYVGGDNVRSKFSILIVEDTKENLDILVEALEDSYDLFLATNGEKALEIIRDNYSTLDLILLDILLPEMDGYQLCEIIKSNEKHKDIPIIFLTGMTALDNKKRGFNLGAVDYITKPFNIEEVKARIEAQISLSAGRKILHAENIYLHKEVHDKDAQIELANKQLEQAHLEIIERLSRAAEFKDDDTGFHVKRVGKISSIISNAIGMDSKLVYALEYAAPLHDIGKIGIADDILLKPGKLNEEEWEIMKNHTIIGKNILKNSSSNIVNIAEIIAFTHHEKWDGSGYPLGLKGEQIPRVSRIVALADVFDALISKRSYKDAYPIEKATEIIIEGKGTHFEPKIVNAFLTSIDEIYEVSKKYRI